MALSDLATRRVCRIIGRISVARLKRMDAIADIILGWSESVEVWFRVVPGDQASRARLLAGERISDPWAAISFVKESFLVELQRNSRIGFI